tara:strand:+ start:1128 stop:1499 length:372 start_codon:yes stop_codon:yes gene_type:complete
MGYRSEVAFAIHPDKVSDFLAVLSGCPKAYDLCRYDDGMKTDMFEKGDLFVAMNGIKWYEGYEGVDTIDKFIADTIDEENGPEMVRFLRVGEDREDIVECGDYAWDDLNITPASIDWTLTKLK